ncbi:response regulator [Eleftheria terrae]|uniref:response regulator n=1 Tax=Eleftheria terrae TaxID=1597781 RepID=UPI00263BC797|nr:response regulator [Eleftheria terrae]WKB54217.1 response regulator [Eleftheria terrae]
MPRSQEQGGCVEDGIDHPAAQAPDAAQRARGAFVALLSHEVRTRMNGVLGMTELVLATELTPQQREFLELAHGSARSLLALINDVLDLSRIEIGQLALQRRPLRLPALVGEVLAGFEAQAGQKDVQLCSEFAAGLPDAIIGDPQRLAQVLGHLVEHALRSTPVGEVRVAAQAEPLPDGRLQLQLLVSDTGTGTTRQQLQQALGAPDAQDPRRPAGACLGLLIALRLVEHMGGQLVADSTPGHGSSLRCTLPCEPAAPEPDARRAPPAPRHWPALHGKRVLLAEDNPVNQTLAVAMLAQLGMSCTLAANGIEAVEQAARGGHDLVLMDVQMPVMGGLEATAEIRRKEGDGPRLPIVAMTSYAMEGDRDRCMAAGMDDYVAKPVQLEALAEAISRVLGHAR